MFICVCAQGCFAWATSEVFLRRRHPHLTLAICSRVRSSGEPCLRVWLSSSRHGILQSNSNNNYCEDTSLTGITSELCFCVSRVQQSVFHGATVGNRSFLELCFHLITDIVWDSGGIATEVTVLGFNCVFSTDSKWIHCHSWSPAFWVLSFLQLHSLPPQPSQFLVLFFHFCLFLLFFPVYNKSD